MSMTRVPPNQPPNDGPADQPISRLDELLADRAAGWLAEGEHAELQRLLAAAGKAEDSSLDLAAAACSEALNPFDAEVELPASLLAALDRECEAWCGGVHSHDGQVVGRIHKPGTLTDVGRGHRVRTPFRRFTREYGGWLAAAACLSFGVYAWSNRQVPGVMGPPKPSAPDKAGFMSRPFELAVDRVSRWFNDNKKFEVVPLSAARPDASADVAVGQVMWNAEDNSGVLQINSSGDSKIDSSHTYRVSVRCPKSGKQYTIETGSVTMHPGQKEVVVPINPPELLHGAAAFVVSICSEGPLGVSQSEGVVGFGGPISDGVGQPESSGG
jgi:hypothetical protein